MRNKIGIHVKLVKTGETGNSGVLIENFPIGYVIEGILLGEIEENKPIRIVHLKNEINRLYGAFCSTNVVKLNLQLDKPWSLTTKNSTYTVEEINKPELDTIID